MQMSIDYTVSKIDSDHTDALTKQLPTTFTQELLFLKSIMNNQLKTANKLMALSDIQYFTL